MARQISSHRRRVLQGMAAAGSLALAPRIAWAQASTSLLRLPRHALIIGNSKYREVPLKNPANDASAVADALKRSGFEVALHLDADRAQMLEAILAHTGYLAKRKAIGLFYFAGHGAQLAWRNYLIPVDAVIDKLEDMPTRTVELNTLLRGLTTARNPMNVIILDACRDNPFGVSLPTEQKGLSQFDAPPGSLLAYATSPGNVASDGEGTNGLYTENLVRELTVPDAKIEDVFKRVRLSVRRRSQGQQIPWESTSLEEDFYFLPPKELRKLAEDEANRLFEEERAIWEKIKAVDVPEPLEEYLRRYPSGRFSELAQFRLDRVLVQQEQQAAALANQRKAAALAEQQKAVEIAERQRVATLSAQSTRPIEPSIAANPFSKGTAKADGNFQIGDRYSYRVTDLFTRLEVRQRDEIVTALTDSEVIYNDGRMITDYLGNYVIDERGRGLTASQYFATEYKVGKKWTTAFLLIRTENRGKAAATDKVELEFKVVGKEKITVPAGTFDAFRVEGAGFVRVSGARWQYVYWIAPDSVRRFVAMEYTNRAGRGGYQANDRAELLSFSQAK